MIESGSTSPSASSLRAANHIGWKILGLKRPMRTICVARCSSSLGAGSRVVSSTAASAYNRDVSRAFRSRAILAASHASSPSPGWIQLITMTATGHRAPERRPPSRNQRPLDAHRRQRRTRHLVGECFRDLGTPRPDDSYGDQTQLRGDAVLAAGEQAGSRQRRGAEALRCTGGGPMPEDVIAQDEIAVLTETRSRRASLCRGGGPRLVRSGPSGRGRRQRPPGVQLRFT
jgi:hypothetical protein